MKKKNLVMTLIIIITVVISLWIIFNITFDGVYESSMVRNTDYSMQGANKTTDNIDNEINYDSYTKILDADLKADGVYTDILVRYNNTLYGKSYALIDYVGNTKGPIGKVDKLIKKEYVPRIHGETNIEEIWNAEVDSIGDKSMVLKYNNEYVLFTKIDEK